MTLWNPMLGSFVPWPAESYSSLLTSVLVGKLPSEIRLIVSREIAAWKWDLSHRSVTIHRKWVQLQCAERVLGRSCACELQVGVAVLTAWPSLISFLDLLTIHKIAAWPLDRIMTPVANKTTGAYVVAPPPPLWIQCYEILSSMYERYLHMYVRSAFGVLLSLLCPLNIL